jgi:hypothetical protein
VPHVEVTESPALAFIEAILSAVVPVLVSFTLCGGLRRTDSLLLEVERAGRPELVDEVRLAPADLQKYLSGPVQSVTIEPRLSGRVARSSAL